MVKAKSHHHHHTEKHFTSGALLRDLVLGMSDGLTVPFALAAGLASAAQSNQLVVTAGMAEIAAGAIAMGLGGYLAGRSEVEHYAREKGREEREIAEIPEEEEEEITAIFAGYGINASESEIIVKALKRRPDLWRDFMMKFELGLEEPNPKQALRSAVTIGGAYVLGGLFPLVPYMLETDSKNALWTSVALTLAALFAFGYVKGSISGSAPWASAFRTMAIGGAAAFAAFAIASYF